MNLVVHRLVLCLLLGAGNAARSNETEALGRLFFTPEQRQALDRRHAHSNGDSTQATGSSRIDGEIWRGKRRRIRWINGQAADAHETRLPALPVGDTIDHASGKRESLLGDGRLGIRRRIQK